jgi:citrate synthase
MPTLEDQPPVTRGLKGVQAADSSICLIDGEKGELSYRGYNIDDLAEHSSFEETAYLLLHGELPNPVQLSDFNSAIGDSSQLPPELIDYLRSVPADAPPMAVLRSAVSHAGLIDPEAEVEGLEANQQKALQLIARIPTIVAAIGRHAAGQEILAADPGLCRAADFVRMLNGRQPTDEEVHSMNLILILHAEHGLCASTFSARVISATLTDLYSAITGAIGALKGKLHGGANTEVLKTLQQLDNVDAVADWVRDVRSVNGKFMGFGHAAYQTADPRAKYLKEMSGTLAAQSDEPKYYDLSLEIEKQVVAEIGRQCNVDFYSASVQYYLGIQSDLFTCVFAASRVVGWCAHVLEQQADNKIIRPSAKYVGLTSRPWTELADRV